MFLSCGEISFPPFFLVSVSRISPRNFRIFYLKFEIRRCHQLLLTFLHASLACWIYVVLFLFWFQLLGNYFYNQNFPGQVFWKSLFFVCFWRKSGFRISIFSVLQSMFWKFSVHSQMFDCRPILNLSTSLLYIFCVFILCLLAFLHRPFF